MKIGELYSKEWERESTLTRKMLERVPADKLSWKPHERSKSLGALALHVANLPGRWVHVFDDDVFDPTLFPQPELTDKDAILRLFDTNSTKLTEALKRTSEDRYDRKFEFKVGGKPQYATSKAMGLRTGLFDHMIHHRAQLSVYLRLLDVPVPGMYGPSADE